MRRKLKAADDGDRQMVSILTCAERRIERGRGGLSGSARSRRLVIVGILNILACSRDPAPGTIPSIPQGVVLAYELVADCAHYDSPRRTSSHGTHQR